ncbi:unnamed protein product [Durusdinium trenchii]|uniref:Uncharacterized protein n=1 Tax=Durusdinium trenchii TaxID=1381693 RepID=A0ABP0NCK5_9DINO
MHQKKHHCLQFLSCLDQFIAARYAQPASTADATCSRPEAGEEVTISYLSDEELFEATMERRMRLRISKDFHCLCQRCSEHWDRSRGVRCRCGSLRFLAAEGSDLSPCDAGCAWPAVEVTKREELLVQLCRQQADADRATRLATAQSFAPAAHQLLPRHWATECLHKWLAEGCATKKEAKECEEKRLEFLQDAYEGAMRNTHTAWVMQSLAMWTLSSCGVLREDPPPSPDCWAAARESGALDLLEKAAQVFKELNGEEDKSLFRRNAWELPPPETVPSNWWEKKGSDDRLNVRTTPPEWIQSTTPPWTARAGHVALVDPETNAVFILGGEGPSGYMADMWKEAFSINLVNLYNMLELGFLQVTSAF